MLFAGPAAAGSFAVNPVQISLPADRRATSLTVTNSDTVPVSIRVAAYAWTRVDGSDVYSETGNVIASPPIFSIAPGKTQLIRIGLRKPGAGAYRVIIEEIPSDAPAEGQIRVALRLNLPLYVTPKGGGKAELSWSAWRDRSGDLFVEARNRGAVHGQVVELSADRGGTTDILSKQMGVVLPGSARRWKVGKQPAIQAGLPLLLKVRSPTSETQTRILVEQR